MPVTLADIARELGVSKMTVSRAINNHPLINAETRERVLEVARRLNYQPNQHARALATNRSHLIGVVVPDLMHSYFAEIYHGVEAVARPLDYRRALEKHRLPPDPALVRDCGFSEREGYEATSKWLAEGDVPGAIFAVNDPAAIGAMQALEEAGLRVSRDVALVGGGNIHYGDMLRVPLTTVSWSTSEMGQQAARLLLQLIEGETPPKGKKQEVVLPPELIVRGSSGAGAARGTGARRGRSGVG